MIASKITYLAIDQWGNRLHLKTKHPRKELLDHYGKQHANKIYVGDGHHIGYIIAGHWYTLYKIAGVGV